MSNLAKTNNSKNLLFKVGNKKYAMPIKSVAEVLELPKLEYPQKLPSNIIGVLNLDNIILNILDIRFYLNLDVTPYSVDSKLIIVRTDESMFGLVVDEIFDVFEIDNSKEDSLPFSAENQIIDSIYNLDNEAISIVNVKSIEKIIKNGYSGNDFDIKTLIPQDEKSSEVLEKRAFALTKRLNTGITKNIFAENKFLSFKLSGTVYCVNLKSIKDVSKKNNIINLPNSPEYIEGLMSLKGDFITILNLKKFLGYATSSYTETSKVVILDAQEYKLGLLVDEVYDVINVLDSELEQKEYNSQNQYIEAEIIENNNIKQVLNIEKILKDDKLHIEDV